MKTQFLISTLSIALAAFAAEQATACSLPRATDYSAGGWETAPSSGSATAGGGAGGLADAASALDFLRPVPQISPIVGMWKFTYTAEGNGVGGPPDGTIVDAGYQTWHSDGTELMNSGRAPATGSFCQGVWAQSSASSYRLNHWALSWDFDPTTQQPTVFVGPTNIKENISLAGYGNTFSGTFSITQYAADGVTVLGGLEGAVTATRITAN
jgi:hypothetical protein